MFEKENETQNVKNAVEESEYDKRVYTVDEIQNILSISKTTAYQLVKANLFQSVRVGGQYRISKKSFNKWLNTINKDIDECQVGD